MSNKDKRQERGQQLEPNTGRLVPAQGVEPQAESAPTTTPRKVERGATISLTPGDAIIVEQGVYPVDGGGQIEARTPVIIRMMAHGTIRFFPAAQGGGVDVVMTNGTPAQATADPSEFEALRTSRDAALAELAEALKNKEPSEALTEALAAQKQRREEKGQTAANIPKAVHHLRRAANSLPNPGDPISSVLNTVTVGLLVNGEAERETIDALARVLAALCMDHNASAANMDVRAAIEALG